MIQEMLPMGISCPRETRDLLLDCCVGKKGIIVIADVLIIFLFHNSFHSISFLPFLFDRIHPLNRLRV